MSKLSGFDPYSVYDSAASEYDSASEKYWNFIPEFCIKLAEIKQGQTVLDACCGPGNGTIPAAVKCGESGKVIAMDYSPQMLEIAETKAKNKNLHNIEFNNSDLNGLELENEYFDSVICSLGIFFVDDMVKLTEKFISSLKHGGRLVIGALDTEFFTPMFSIWKEELAKHIPGITFKFPWERTNTVEKLTGVFDKRRSGRIKIITETHHIELNKPEEWWKIVMGSGMRKYITDTERDIAEKVFNHNIDYIKKNKINSLALGVQYALFVKE